MTDEGRDLISDVQNMILNRLCRYVSIYNDERNGAASQDLMQHMAVLVIGAAAAADIIDRWDAKHRDES